MEFWPQVSGPRSLGVTDKEGRFTLTADDGKSPGAVVESHKVVLIDLASHAKAPVKMPREVEKINLASTRFGKQFADPNKTPPKKEVVAGETALDILASP